MYYIKLFIFISITALMSCSQSIQNNGLSELKFKEIKIEVGKTSKMQLVNKYGPPIFESIFNRNVIYYISHKTSYKLLDKFKTKKLLVYEIKLNEKNIVTNFQKYSEEDAINISVSDKSTDDDNNLTFIFKELLNNMRRNNIQN